MAKYAIWVMLKAKPGKEDDIEAFLKQGASMSLEEPKTVNWYGVKIAPGMYGVFDTFDDEEAANFSSGVACSDSTMARSRSSCCSTRSMATLITRAAEAVVLRGDDIELDHSTGMVERNARFPKIDVEHAGMATTNCAFSGLLSAFSQPRIFHFLLHTLRSKEWVVYSKPPFGGPEHVFRLPPATPTASPSPMEGCSASIADRWVSAGETPGTTTAAHNRDPDLLDERVAGCVFGQQHWGCCGPALHQ